MKSGGSSSVKLSLRHRCPVCGAALEILADSEITCSGCGRKFPVVDGIPSLLARENPGIFETYFNEIAKTESDAARKVAYLSSRQQSLILGAFQQIMTNIPPGSLLLEVGCGHGVFASNFTGKHTMVGIDFSFPMLRMARKCGLVPYHADAAALPFQDDQFDAVVCAELFQYFSDIGPVMGEAVRVCRPGGSVIVSTLNRKSVLQTVQIGYAFCGHKIRSTERGFQSCPTFQRRTGRCR